MLWKMLGERKVAHSPDLRFSQQGRPRATARAGPPPPTAPAHLHLQQRAAVLAASRRGS